MEHLLVVIGSYNPGHVSIELIRVMYADIGYKDGVATEW
jgi:hypothetical protein